MTLSKLVYEYTTREYFPEAVDKRSLPVPVTLLPRKANPPVVLRLSLLLTAITPLPLAIELMVDSYLSK